MPRPPPKKIFANPLTPTSLSAIITNVRRAHNDENPSAVTKADTPDKALEIR